MHQIHIDTIQLISLSFSAMEKLIASCLSDKFGKLNVQLKFSFENIFLGKYRYLQSQSFRENILHFLS